MKNTLLVVRTAAGQMRTFVEPVRVEGRADGRLLVEYVTDENDYGDTTTIALLPAGWALDWFAFEALDALDAVIEQE